MENYKGYEIDDSFGDFYTVLYCGDEVAFNTIEEAKEFIDEIA